MPRFRLRPQPWIIGGTGRIAVSGALQARVTKTLGSVLLGGTGRSAVSGSQPQWITGPQTVSANPSNYVSVLAAAAPGSTIQFVGGDYPGLSIYSKSNITIEGPTDRSARITGSVGNNTVRISGSNNITIKNLTIDSLQLGGDGIHAQSNVGPSYAITIDNCRITGCDDSQSTAGIGANSVSCWDWTIKNNIFDGCGTGMYLGNSDGASPFVRGIIEGNYFTNCIGYNCEIKGQTVWGTTIAGRPEGTTKTIIRNNVWNKNVATSSTGGNSRPNLLIGGVASAGTGSSNTYEIYGNFFVGNPTDEPLLQVSGNCYIYNNVFYNIDGGAGSLGAIYARDWTSTAPTTVAPLKNIEVFSNTIVIDAGIGVDINGGTGFTRNVKGNAIYAPTATALTNATAANNTTGTFAGATAVMNKPDGVLGSTLDLHPQTGQLSGAGYSDVAWSSLTGYNLDFNGASRVFTVRGAYGTQGVNPGWFLQLNRKGDGIPAPAPTTLDVLYDPDEGTATLSYTGSSLFWQSNFATKDGTLIEWGNGTHGHQTPNYVIEYDPVTGTQTYVEPTNIITGLGTNPYKTATFGYMTQHDNHHYLYIPRIDSLVIPAKGQYVRGSSSRPVAEKFPYATRTEVTADGNIVNGTGTSFVDSQPLGWKNGQRMTALSGGLYRPVGSMATNPGYYSPPDDYFGGVYNPHQAWSPQLDAGFLIGGGNSVGDDHGVCFIIMRSTYFGSYTEPYVVVMKTVPTIGGIKPNKRQGRDGACAVGEYIYWVGGLEDNGTTSAHFWRMNLGVFLNSSAQTIPQNSGAGAIERLLDAPFAASWGLLRHDPFTNTLLLISNQGIALFDLRSMTWNTSALTATNAAYLAEYNQYLIPGGYPNSGTPFQRPSGCLGDFISERIVGGAVTARPRKFYWRPGSNEPDGVGGDQRQRRYRSIKVLRPLETVSAINVETENPANTSTTISGPLLAIKHHAIIENFNDGYNPGQASRRITLFGGDWDNGWPSSTRADYPPIGVAWNNSDGRQEMWDADVSDAVLASGTIRLKLAQNFYHNYPWNGSTGYSGAGGFGGVEPQRGPYMPDGLGFVIDKRGEYWMGPCDVGYTAPLGDAAGEQFAAWAPMYKWTKPGVHPVSGIRLGNGWTRPSQNRLKRRGAANGGYTTPADWDVGIASDSEAVGWGRPNNSAYDPVNDCIWVVGVNVSGGSTMTVALYKFPCVPTSGTHTWTRHVLATVSLKVLGGPDNGTGNASTGSTGDGDICNTVYCNGNLYFTHTQMFYVPAESNWQNINGYTNSTTRRMGRIIKVNLNGTTPASSTLEWVPFPEACNWWLRTYDGPEGGEAASLGYSPLTTSQYRSLKAVGTKLVAGPDGDMKVAIDPWICVYDTMTKTWTTFNPPASFPLTNGGHDWPHSIFSLTAMPSLGEVWLTGKGAPGPLGDAQDIWRQSKGMLRTTAYQVQTGQMVGRRIIRFKI
jgi:hypothetical protein